MNLLKITKIKIVMYFVFNSNEFDLINLDSVKGSLELFQSMPCYMYVKDLKLLPDVKKLTLFREYNYKR